MIHRLIYASRISTEAGSRLASTLEDILVVSAVRNAHDQITGLLLADGQAFAQVLEGPKPAVEACFARILADRRHHRVTLRLAEDAERRRFPRWSMCGLTLSAEDDALLGAPDIEFDLTAVSGGALLQHLDGIAARHAARLDARHAAILAAARG